MKRQQTKGKINSVVLCVYPNAIGFGYAVMEDTLLVHDAQVVNIRPVSNREALKRVKKIINYYQPKIIVLEDYKGIGSRKSKRIQKFIRNISLYAQKTNLKTNYYSRANIRFVFSNFNAFTKHEIAVVIAQNIKLMEHKVPAKRKVNEAEKYMSGAFDAISLGMTHYYMKD